MSKRKRQVKRKEMTPIQLHRWGTVLNAIKIYVDKHAHINYNADGVPAISYTIGVGRKFGKNRKPMPLLWENDVNRIFLERYA